MVGIIYKFTILVKYKFYGNKPFYVGQHWCKKSKKDFLKYDYRYCGSGYIWNDFLKKLKTEYPSCWRKLIKREVLFSLNKDDKPLLSKMEEYYIKKEHACYKNKNGGCNTEVSVPSVNPFFDKNRCERQRELKNKLFSSKRGDEVRKKMSDSHYNCVGENNPMYGSRWINNGIKTKRLYLGEKMPDGWVYGNLQLCGKNNPMYGKKWSDEEKRIFSEKIKGLMVGEKNPMYGKKSPFKGKHHTEENKKIFSKLAKERFKDCKNHPMYGKHLTKEQREKMSESKKRLAQGDNYVNPMQDKVRITNGKVNTIILKDTPLPDGYWYGMTRGIRRRKKYEN